MNNTFSTAYEWFTADKLKPDTRTEKWVILTRKLQAIGALPWQYCAYLIWYDERTPNETFSVLSKYPYVHSEEAFARFRGWLHERSETLPPKVKYQIDNLRTMKERGYDAEYLVLSRNIDASTMVRLEMACEWREELTLHDIMHKMAKRAIEMYMCFPLYKKLTPLAWQLIEDHINGKGI